MTQDMTREQAAELTNRCVTILAAAIDRDADAAGREITQIAETSGDAGVFCVATAVAEAVRRSAYPYNGTASVQMLTGGEPEDLSPDLRAELFAARFLAAHVNGDSQTAMALFRAPILAEDDEQACRNVAALVNLAASIARHQLAGESS